MKLKLGAPPPGAPVEPLKLKPVDPVGAAAGCVVGAPEPPKLNPVLLELCCKRKINQILSLILLYNRRESSIEVYYFKLILV